MRRKIEATATLAAPAWRVRRLLTRGLEHLLRDEPGVTVRGDGTMTDHVTLDLGGGGTVDQEVLVELGEPEVRADTVTVPLRWEPAGHERLLPSFDGELCAGSGAQEDSSLVLRGTYEVPLGSVGRFGDTLLGHRVARRSLSAYAERVAHRLEAEVRGGGRAAAERERFLAFDVRDDDQPENYLG